MLSFVIFCVFNFPKINGKFNLLANAQLSKNWSRLQKYQVPQSKKTLTNPIQHSSCGTKSAVINLKLFDAHQIT